MNQDAALLAARLRAEIEVFQEFHHALQLEQEALIQGQAERLLELASRKSALIEQLSAFGGERQRNLAAAGLESNSSGMTAWLDLLGADQEARELWNRLLDLARDAEQMNRRNGTLIETHLRHNQQALAVLNSAGNPAGVYGRNGQFSGLAGGRSRDKA